MSGDQGFFNTFFNLPGWNCRHLVLVIIVLVMVILFLLWQIKRQSVGTPQIQVTDRSVSVRHQGTSASTCCGAGVPRFLLSLPTTPGPQSEVIIEEELNLPYVKAVLKKNAVPQERLEAAIRYLNTREGGKYCIQAGISWVEDEKA